MKVGRAGVILFAVRGSTAVYMVCSEHYKDTMCRPNQDVFKVVSSDALLSVHLRPHGTDVVSVE
jgi:hypothetical protein